MVAGENNRPNPPPLPSFLPEDVLVLATRPEIKDLSDDDYNSLRSFQRAACYIAASMNNPEVYTDCCIVGLTKTTAPPAMIFLRDNELVESPLEFSYIKSRLLGKPQRPADSKRWDLPMLTNCMNEAGHWGTCPGIILVWAYLNRLIRNHDLSMILIVGPGHGTPAALATLWLEGSMERSHPGKYDRNRVGLRNLILRFSVPGSHPRQVAALPAILGEAANSLPCHDSYINPETSGAIYEGRELGYALAVSFGAVMDNPNLIVACLVGDGEAKSGPTVALVKSLDEDEDYVRAS